jgi:hypothetical protein
VSTNNLDSSGRSYHTLGKRVAADSNIIATIFKRENEEIREWRDYLPRSAFSGILSDDDETPEETADGDAITWANVDTTKREFITRVVDESVRLYFNQNVIEDVTELVTPTVVDDFNDLEYLGSSTGLDDQRFYSKYFPLAGNSNTRVFVVDVATGSFLEWTSVTRFTTGVFNEVLVDYDLGRIVFGTASAGGVPSVNRGIYLMYQAVPRIEYEQEGYGKEFTALEADVNPFNSSLNRGFVVLTQTESDIASLFLTTTKPKLGSTEGLHGPVYAGSDYAPLYATAFSSDGKAIPSKEITFRIETTQVGGLGTVMSDRIQHMTDSLGVARTSYIPPISASSMGFFVTSVTGGNQLVLNSEARFSDTDEIYTYYVLKDDPWLGKVGADEDLGETDWLANPMNGRKAILYEWSALAINPITGYLGAYVPVRPTTISSSGNVLTYGATLEEPDPTYSAPDGTDILDPDYPGYPQGKNLAAYWVVADRYVTIRASAWSERHGRTIYSNPITIKVTLPDSMKGSFIAEGLGEIPYGWRLSGGVYSSSGNSIYDAATVIGGATYICINPIAGPYPIINILAGEDISDYEESIVTPIVYGAYGYFGYSSYYSSAYTYYLGDFATYEFGRFSIKFDVTI